MTGSQEIDMSSALQEKPGADDLPKVSGASILLDGRYLPPPADKDGKQWVRTTALVQADAELLYEMWSDLESIPMWQEEIAEVRVTGPKTSHWVMKSGDKTVEWDSEILADEPGKRIAWRSTGGDVHQASEVIFEEAPGGRGTTVIVLQEFGISGIASAIATVVDRNPKQAVVENLRHFKALAETGEIPRSQNAPHGDRGVVGKWKRSAYGEKVPTPPGV
jgi:uncharacterized membrane protein